MDKKLTAEDLRKGTLLVRRDKDKHVFMIVEEILEKCSINMDNYKLLNLCSGKTLVLSINTIKEDYQLTVGEEIKLW